MDPNYQTLLALDYNDFFDDAENGLSSDGVSDERDSDREMYKRKRVLRCGSRSRSEGSSKEFADFAPCYEEAHHLGEYLVDSVYIYYRFTT